MSLLVTLTCHHYLHSLYKPHLFSSHLRQCCFPLVFFCKYFNYYFDLHVAKTIPPFYCCACWLLQCCWLLLHISTCWASTCTLPAVLTDHTSSFYNFNDGPGTFQCNKEMHFTLQNPCLSSRNQYTHYATVCIFRIYHIYIFHIMPLIPKLPVSLQGKKCSS